MTNKTESGKTIYENSDELSALADEVFKTEEWEKGTVHWAEGEAKKCKLCFRNKASFCKRHSPNGMSIKKTTLFTQEQVDKLLQKEREKVVAEHKCGESPNMNYDGLKDADKSNWF